jgi:hypothetical protein
VRSGLFLTLAIVVAAACGGGGGVLRPSSTAAITVIEASADEVTLEVPELI